MVGAAALHLAALCDVYLRLEPQFYPDVYLDSGRGMGPNLPEFFATILWDSRREFSNVRPASECFSTGVCALLAVGQQVVFPVAPGQFENFPNHFVPDKTLALSLRARRICLFRIPMGCL